MFSENIIPTAENFKLNFKRLLDVYIYAKWLNFIQLSLTVTVSAII